ncbi:Mu transposase C-terminal domain-containing protein [Streptomyces sp. NPDC102467]|uniref:Mu transposase C-terminal domain-containing protein n=1 Tax=Streptomyces sp. NPDC102467 TaxID=3366179 RepID=UPI0038258CE6
MRTRHCRSRSSSASSSSGSPGGTHHLSQALGGRTPLEAWRADPTPIEGVAPDLLHRFTLADDGRTRTLTPSGVRWHGRYYIGPWMTGRAHAGTKVRIRYTPISRPRHRGVRRRLGPPPGPSPPGRRKHRRTTPRAAPQQGRRETAPGPRTGHRLAPYPHQATDLS